MNAQLPRVRLSKDAKFAVCASVDCGWQFAHVSRDFDDYRRGGRREHMKVEYLDFPAGWTCGPDGVWKMSRRVFERLQEGRPPASRRDPQPRRLRGGLVDVTTGKVTILGLPRHRKRRPGNNADEGGIAMAERLPVGVLCPRCDLLQIADAASLSAS